MMRALGQRNLLLYGGEAGNVAAVVRCGRAAVMSGEA